MFLLIHSISDVSGPFFFITAEFVIYHHIQIEEIVCLKLFLQPDEQPSPDFFELSKFLGFWVFMKC